MKRRIHVSADMHAPANRMQIDPLSSIVAVLFNVGTGSPGKTGMVLSKVWVRSINSIISFLTLCPACWKILSTLGRGLRYGAYI